LESELADLRLVRQSAERLCDQLYGQRSARTNARTGFMTSTTPSRGTTAMRRIWRCATIRTARQRMTDGQRDL
jgi:hypothetical protein